jgi:hypothetical protein
MARRRISKDDVRNVLDEGENIELYPTNQPYPSRLVLGWIGTRPLHVSVADNEGEEELIVITVYEPTLEHWQPGFKLRN